MWQAWSAVAREDSLSSIPSMPDPRVISFAEPAGDLPVVSAPRLFADLSMFAGRGSEAADHVKEQLINPLHRGLIRENPSDA